MQYDCTWFLCTLNLEPNLRTEPDKKKLQEPDQTKLIFVVRFQLFIKAWVFFCVGCTFGAKMKFIQVFRLYHPK